MAEDVFGIVGTTQANSYKVESVVAEGGFGVVYRAYHGAFRASVALKCLKIPQSLSEKAKNEFLERFREEAEVMFRLSASVPAVVRPLHVDVISTKDGVFVPFVALEWLDGETLDALIARRRDEGRPPLAMKRAVRMIAPVARALERAHNFPGAGGPISIVHRDLKPDNIFIATVNGEEQAKILDFGIAKVKNTASQIAGRISQSEAGLMAFTPGYGAPEQWLPKRFGQTGPWTDVWGLALTLVETLVGRPVIDGDHAGMMGTAIDEKRRPTPRTEGVQVTDEVELVFQRALAVDPRNRQQDCGIFWDELESALNLERTSVFVGRRDRRAEDAVPQQREEKIDVSASSAAPRATYGSVPDLGEPGSGARALPDAPQPSSPRPSLEPPPAPPPSLAPPPLAPSSLAPPRHVPTLFPQARPESSPPDLRPSQRQLQVAPTVASVAPPPPPVAPAPMSLGGAGIGGLPSFGDEREPFEVSGGASDIVLEIDSSPRAVRQGWNGGAMSGPGALSGASVPSRTPRVGPPPVHRSAPDLKQKLGMPVGVALAGIGIATIDQVWAQTNNGESIALGPVRLVWVAGLLAVVGTGLVLLRLLAPSED